jgi:hypothetical protein
MEIGLGLELVQSLGKKKKKKKKLENSCLKIEMS